MFFLGFFRGADEKGLNRGRLSPLSTHHDQEVQHEDERQAAGVAEEPCDERKWPPPVSRGNEATGQQQKKHSYLPILRSNASGSTTHSVTRISRTRPSSYQALVGEAGRKVDIRVPVSPDYPHMHLAQTRHN